VFRDHDECLQVCNECLLCLSWRDVSDRLKQAHVVEPVDPRQRFRLYSLIAWVIASCEFPVVTDLGSSGPPDHRKSTIVETHAVCEAMMTQEEHAVAALAKALGHPARIRILRLLQATPGCTGGAIVDAVGLAQSTVSEHLRVLKSAGVISGEIDGPRICYALHPDATAPLAAFLTGLSAPLADTCCTTFAPRVEA